jgi:uncharacterized membrane protein YvbJ
MYCPKCGNYNDDNAFTCAKCGQGLRAVQRPPEQPAQPGYYQQPQQPYQQVDDYLLWSILATVLCCLVPGIVAIIYSSQVKSKLAMGDYAGAVQSANTAKTWVWVAVGLGVIPAVAGIAWMVIAIAAAMSGAGGFH